MVLGYLILAHLLGDFIFQPAKLVLWKKVDKKGGLAHATVHFLITTIVLLPYILNGSEWLVYAALVIAFIHFWIDQTKINYDVNHDKKVLPFLIDQFLHLLTILVVYFLIRSIPLSLDQNLLSVHFYNLYTDVSFVIFLSVIILVSKVIEVYRFQKQREKNKNAKLSINSDHMLKRIILITLIYIIFMILRNLSFYAGKSALF